MGAGPSSHLVINMVPATLSEPEILDNAQAVYGIAPLTILPYTPEFAAVGTGEVFVATHPEHEVSLRIQALVRTLTGRATAPNPLPREYVPHTLTYSNLAQYTRIDHINDGKDLDSGEFEY
jgi:MinD-like ATPase involved in chromosome partitioning or flagellar assembly